MTQPTTPNDSLANRKRPRTLHSVRGHPTIVTTISLVIANDLWSQHSPLFLQGSPGSGKTTLALLSARATLCPSRAMGTSDNCGVCDTCMGRDTTNIIQYTCTGADADAIANLIDIGRGQPLPKEGSPRYRFFILDEVSNMSNQQLSKFLEVLEGTNPYNVWILVSMKPEKLDPTLSNALLSRCSTFTLPPLTTEDIAATLMGGGVSEPIANAIAPYTKGNARFAWRKFDSLLLLNPDATPEWIEAYLTGGATKEARRRMWYLLYKGEVKPLIELVEGWGCDRDTLLTLVKEDVVEAMCTRPSQLQAKVLHSLTVARDGEGILYLLLAWLGMDVLGLHSHNDRVDKQPMAHAPCPTGRSVIVPTRSPWSILRDKYGLH